MRIAGLLSVVACVACVAFACAAACGASNHAPSLGGDATHPDGATATAADAGSSAPPDAGVGGAYVLDETFNEMTPGTAPIT